MSPFDRDRLVGGAAELGVPLDAEQVARFEGYAALLAEWNARMNLTRIPAEEVVPLHFLDSLAAARAVDFRAGGRLVDVGTGAGLPGLALKIAFPALDVTLLDATRKRLVFLDTVIEEMGLNGARTLHARAEEAGRAPAERESYDISAARAVARFNVLAEWLLPLTRVGGRAVALKSAGVIDEMAEARGAARTLGADIERLETVVIPGTEIERRIVVMHKIRPTPVRYPRPFGATRAHPLR